jgi:hypothetical protein
MFHCQVCWKQSFTATEAGNHLRNHGVNLFPEVIRLVNLVKKIEFDNKNLTRENAELKSRLRIVAP